MSKVPSIKCLFVDLGGVLLSNGWDRHARERTAAAFQLDLAELQDRHHLTFDTFECGKLTLRQYLDFVVFHTPRSFTRAQFQRAMFAESRPYLDMLTLLAQLKAQYGLKVAVVSNEGRELNAYRIRKFKLTRIVDFFVCSALVHLRKPDADIFRLALDMAQMPVDQIVYLENTPIFVQVAESLGIRSILHKDYESTRAQLALFGLNAEKGVVHGDS